MIRVNKWWLGVACLVILCAFQTIEAQDGTIVISGTIVMPQKILNKGWVVIKQGKISQIRERVPTEENAIWVRTDDIIFPGFIDLHNHPLYAVFRRWEPGQKFNNRYEWRSSGDYQKKVGKPGNELQADEQSFCDLTQFAEVQALTGGTTSFSGMFPRRPPAAPLPACLSKLAVRKLDMNSGFYLTEPGHERVQNVLGVTPRDLNDVVADEVVRKLAGNELDLVLIHVAEGKRVAERVVEEEKAVEGPTTDLESTLEFSLLRFAHFSDPKRPLFTVPHLAKMIFEI